MSEKLDPHTLSVSAKRQEVRCVAVLQVAYRKSVEGGIALDKTVERIRMLIQGLVAGQKSTLELCDEVKSASGREDFALNVRESDRIYLASMRSMPRLQNLDEPLRTGLNDALTKLSEHRHALIERAAIMDILAENSGVSEGAVAEVSQVS